MFQDRISLCNSPDCPGTYLVDQAGWPPTSAKIKSMGHHAQRRCNFLYIYYTCMGVWFTYMFVPHVHTWGQRRRENYGRYNSSLGGFSSMVKQICKDLLITSYITWPNYHAYFMTRIRQQRNRHTAGTLYDAKLCRSPTTHAACCQDTQL